MGRPTKLTSEVEARIVKALKAGNRLSTAARFAGIHPATLHRWLQRGATEGTNPAEAPYREFAAQVDQAIAEAEVRDVTTISKATETDWRAAAWRLAHRHPEQWGRQAQREDNARPGGLTQDALRLATGFLKRLTDDQLELLAESLGVGEQQDHAAPSPPTLMLHLRQAIWDELYDRRVTTASPYNRDFGHELVQALASGTDADVADFQAGRDEVARQHELPPRPR